MNSVFFYIFLIFYTFQVICADLTLEEKEKENNSTHLNKSDWMTRDLFDLELSSIKQMETIAYPLLDEIRHGAEVTRKAFKDPSDCIHTSTKFLLSSVDEFYDELDHCSITNNQANNMQDVGICSEKIVSAFRSLANGGREYFKYCIENIPINSHLESLKDTKEDNK